MAEAGDDAGSNSAGTETKRVRYLDQYTYLVGAPRAQCSAKTLVFFRHPVIGEKFSEARPNTVHFDMLASNFSRQLRPY